METGRRSVAGSQMLRQEEAPLGLPVDPAPHAKRDRYREVLSGGEDVTPLQAFKKGLPTKPRAKEAAMKKIAA